VTIDEPLQYDEEFQPAPGTGAGDATGGPEVGLGPHPEPWPGDSRLDRELLAHGDRRNVVDEFRYWRREAIVAEPDTRRHGFHVAVGYCV
jgi:hypothetical protein